MRWTSLLLREWHKCNKWHKWHKQPQKLSRRIAIARKVRQGTGARGMHRWPRMVIALLVPLAMLVPLVMLPLQ
jgi:hypothetical protein